MLVFRQGYPCILFFDGGLSGETHTSFQSLGGTGNAASCLSLANLRSCHVHDLHPSVTERISSFSLPSASLPDLPSFPCICMTPWCRRLAAIASVESILVSSQPSTGAKPRWIRDAPSVPSFAPSIDDRRRSINRGALLVPSIRRISAVRLPRVGSWGSLDDVMLPKSYSPARLCAAPRGQDHQPAPSQHIILFEKASKTPTSSPIPEHTSTKELSSIRDGT